MPTVIYVETNLRCVAITLSESALAGAAESITVNFKEDGPKSRPKRCARLTPAIWQDIQAEVERLEGEHLAGALDDVSWSTIRERFLVLDELVSSEVGGPASPPVLIVAPIPGIPGKDGGK